MTTFITHARKLTQLHPLLNLKDGDEEKWDAKNKEENKKVKGV